MKAWLWLLLGLLAVAPGCAQGYYDHRPAYRDTAPTMNWYQNPETEEEYQLRLWDEEIHSHD